MLSLKTVAGLGANMVVLEICFIVGGVLIIVLINFVVLKKYWRAKNLLDGKERQEYKPAERDALGHVYY